MNYVYDHANRLTRLTQMPTTDSAALGIAEETGSVEPCKRADLLVVDGDPLAEIAILQDPAKLLAVIRDGRLLVDRGLSATRQ